MNHSPRRHWLTLGALSVVMCMLAFVPANNTASTLRMDPNIELASCAPNDDRYFALVFRNAPFEEWANSYHSTVSTVIDEYLKPLESVDCEEEQILSIEPSSPLLALANKLPPWNTTEELEALEVNDVGFVLLEYLRIYECSLKDRKRFLRLYLQEELDAADWPHYTYGIENSKVEEDLLLIQQELDIARPILERALQILAGTTRLTVLDAELQCIQRSSLDLRNALSLAADTSSCLPRIWNAKDVLRDTP